MIRSHFDLEEFPDLMPVVETREVIRGGVELVQRTNARIEAELERRGLPKGPVPPRRFLAMLPGGR